MKKLLPIILLALLLMPTEINAKTVYLRPNAELPVFISLSMMNILSNSSIQSYSWWITGSDVSIRWKTKDYCILFTSSNMNMAQFTLNYRVSYIVKGRAETYTKSWTVIVTPPGDRSKWTDIEDGDFFQDYTEEGDLMLFMMNVHGKTGEKTAFVEPSPNGKPCISTSTKGKVTIPAYAQGFPVTYIEDNAFKDILEMETLVIPKTMQIIGATVINNCPKVTSVISMSETPPSPMYGSGEIFDWRVYNNATLHVPEGTQTLYQNANGWSRFSNIVEAGKVKLNKSKAILEKGKTVTLKATVTPSSLSNKKVTWKSSNKKVATVTSGGKVKGIKEGTATITCTSVATGAKATCKVTVSSVSLNKSKVALEKGKTVTLKATISPSTLKDKSVTWKSSNTSVATVSSSGKVKGVKYGTATITCTYVATGQNTTCKVTVGHVALDKSKVSVKKGKTVTLKATVYPSSLSNKKVIWKTSNKKIATVTSAGKVKGVKAGTVTITCTSNATGLSTTCKVTVTATSGTRSVDGDDDDGTTGIEEIESMDDNPAATGPFDVYDLSGRKVRNQVTSLDGLPNGIYIVNGKKVLKK